LKQHGYKQPKAHPNPIPEELYFESFLVNLTIEEIERAREQDVEAPFFAYLSMYAPHGPHVPPGKWATVYDDVPLPEINYTEGEVERLPVHLRRLIGVLGDEKAETEALRGIHEADSEVRREADERRRLYYGYAAYCDAQVGRILDYLDASGLRDNTLVIFSSDHGHELYDHGVNNKHNYFDSSWRVPLIMSLPGTLPQGETREFAIWNDITASILGAAGTKCDTMQGFDLFTPLAAGDPSPRQCAVGTLYKSAALATRRWKLEYYFEEGEGRLFDRLNDPKEQRDVYRHPEFAPVRGELVEALLGWRSDIADLHSLLAGSARHGGGGPVATRILDHTLAMRGTDAEQRLNEKAMKLDRN
jgi:arylsulfatase A-like enzyme